MKSNILLLHGALSSHKQFLPFIPFIEEKFHIHNIDFEGHGERPLTKNTFLIDYFVDNVIEYLDAHSISSIDIFGYSMGGYVAVRLAQKFPERVKKIYTLATKFFWSPEIAKKEIQFLNPEIMQQKIPAYVVDLEKRHTAIGWKNVLHNTKEMMIDLGNHNYLSSETLKNVSHPIRIGVGDRDVKVSIEESITAYKTFLHGELIVLPATLNPFEKVCCKKLSTSLFDFFV